MDKYKISKQINNNIEFKMIRKVIRYSKRKIKGRGRLKLMRKGRKETKTLCTNDVVKYESCLEHAIL